MIEKIELNHLRTLNALYKFLNMAAAAEHLGISQQAISLQLKKLRDILKDPLFVRTGQGMAPTPYARHIEPHVHGVLALINNIPHAGAGVLKDVEQTLVISATDYAQRIIVGDLVSEIREAAPQVRIIVANIESASLVKKMQRGEISIAFTSNGYVPQGLESEPLFTGRYVCVAAKALHGDGEHLPLSTLVSHDFVVVSPGVPSFKGSANAWFEQQGLRRNVVLTVPSFFVAEEYLRRTGLVGFLPSRLLPCHGLVEIPLQKYPPGYEVVAAYHPGAAADPLLKWLLARVRDRFAAS